MLIPPIHTHKNTHAALHPPRRRRAPLSPTQRWALCYHRAGSVHVHLWGQHPQRVLRGLLARGFGGTFFCWLYVYICVQLLGSWIRSFIHNEHTIPTPKNNKNARPPSTNPSPAGSASSRPPLLPPGHRPHASATWPSRSAPACIWWAGGISSTVRVLSRFVFVFVLFDCLFFVCIYTPTYPPPPNEIAKLWAHNTRLPIDQTNRPTNLLPHSYTNRAIQNPQAHFTRGRATCSTPEPTAGRSCPAPPRAAAPTAPVRTYIHMYVYGPNSIITPATTQLYIYDRGRATRSLGADGRRLHSPPGRRGGVWWAVGGQCGAGGWILGPGCRGAAGVMGLFWGG